MTPILTFIPIQLRSLYTTLLQPKSFNHIMASTNHDSNTLVLIDIFCLSHFDLLPFYSPLLLQIVTQVAAQSYIAISLFLFTVSLSTSQGPPPTPQVDAASEPSGYIPLHLACLTGHVGVVGLLLSRSTELLKVEKTSKDIGLLARSGRNVEYDIILWYSTQRHSISPSRSEV